MSNKIIVRRGNGLRVTGRRWEWGEVEVQEARGEGKITSLPEGSRKTCQRMPGVERWWRKSEVSLLGIGTILLLGETAAGKEEI